MSYLKLAAYENDYDQNLNPKIICMWIACHFAPLLVIWSPWVNGFTLPCLFVYLFPYVLVLPFICCPSNHVSFLFYIFPHSSQDNA